MSDYTSYNRRRHLAIVTEQIMQEAYKTQQAKAQMEERKKLRDKPKELVTHAN